jgi:hypothetical protein
MSGIVALALQKSLMVSASEAFCYRRGPEVF